MQTDIDAIVAGLPPLETPLSYYHELDDTYFSVTSDTFIGQVYSLFGLRNIADEAEGDGGLPAAQRRVHHLRQPRPDLPRRHQVLRRRPSTSSSARPGWDDITAVANGDVFALDDDIASRWGPRVVDYVRTVADAVQQALVRRRLTPAPIDGDASSARPWCRRRRGSQSAGRRRCSAALLLGAMIGPAGPAWWRVPLALLDHLPLVSRRQRRHRRRVEHRSGRCACHGSCSPASSAAMLSLAGASYQGVFRNPLVDPYLLGAAAGAGLGATLVFTVGRDADRRLAGRPGAGRGVPRRRSSPCFVTYIGRRRVRRRPHGRHARPRRRRRRRRS